MPINIFDGSSWIPSKNIKIYDGSAWQDSKSAFIYDGTSWKAASDLTPVNTALPTLSLENGASYYSAQEIVSTSTGSWTNSPLGYIYQWQKGINGSDWQDIAGETNVSLYLNEDSWDSLQTLKYVGYTLRCKVTAVNAAGNAKIPVYTATSPIVGPAKQTDITTNVTSNGVIEITWQKVKAATDYYMQYQGPQVAFTEITSLVNNADSTKGVYSVSGNTVKFTIDTGSSGGTLGILVSPKNTSNVSGQAVTGLGANGSVNDLKPNKPAISASMTSNATGGTLNWSTNLITQTGWVIYNEGQAYDNSVYAGGAARTFYDISQLGVGGTSYGSFSVKIIGTAPRFTETEWTSSPALPIVYPLSPTPVNTAAPTISAAGNGRVFSCSAGTWTNSGSIYSYIYDWKANGSGLNIASGSTLDLASTTAYDGMTITCSVSVLLTDLRMIGPVSASNSATSQAAPPPVTYEGLPNLVGGSPGSSTSLYNLYYSAVTMTSNASLAGLVASQSPAAGTQIASNARPTTLSVSLYSYSAPQTQYYTIPDYVGGSTSDGSYGNFVVTTGTRPSTDNSALNNTIASQSPIAGTQFNQATTTPPFTVTVSRYSYVASGVPAYVSCYGPSGNYNGALGTPPAASSGYSYVTGTVPAGSNSQQIISLLGIPPSCAVTVFAPPSFFAPPGFFSPPGFFAPPGFFSPPGFFAPPSFPGFIPWFGPPCVEENTLVDTMDGQVPAKFLQVGDKIKSALINEIDSSTADSYQMSTFSSNELTIGEFVETTIVSIDETQEADIVYFNNRIDTKVTFTQPVFVKTIAGEYKIKEAYYVEIGEFLILVDSEGNKSEVEITDINYLTDSIVNVYQYSCEPYDWFFANGMLVHNK